MRKFEDLVGRIFGKFTVTGPMEYYKGNMYWWCQCACGNKRRVSKASLSRGTSKSCGCTRRISNLEGKRFSRLLVTGKSPKGGQFWSCLCDCGNTKEYGAHSLVSGQNVSCGCKNHEFTEMVGLKFGRLTVVAGPIRRPNEQYLYWLCKCDCGNQVETRGTSLRAGVTTSCHCASAERVKGLKSLPNGRSVDNYILYTYQKNAAKRGLDWGLTDQEALALIHENCHYCGAPPKLKTVKDLIPGHIQGIDRKNNAKGYSVENTVTCCSFCNRAKMTMPYDEFIKNLNRVAAYRSISVLTARSQKNEC